MSGGDEETRHRARNGKGDGRLLRFPQSRVAPRRSPGGYRDLGLSGLARMIGVPREQQTGHYCSRCDGIWFGYPLEVECPVCGNRKG